MDVVSGALNALFTYKPFFRFASHKAKEMIVKRGTEIGHPWAPQLAALKLHDWDSELNACLNRSLEYPEVHLLDDFG